VAIPVLSFVFSRVVAERMGVIILSAFVAHTAWHWLTDRWAIFRRYDAESAFGIEPSSLLVLAALAGLAGVVVTSWRVFRARGSRVPRDAV
jgi:hypothetical protein